MSSIKDVAKLAGVSWMTVSRVINQPEKVGDKTREKVQKAIETLAYAPYESAQKMRSRGSSQFEDKTIVVLALDVATTPFSVDILYAIEDTLKKYGWHAIVINTFDTTPSDATIRKVLAQHPAGIIYTSMGLRSVTVPERLQSIPLVLANCITSSCECPSYIPNDYRGQYDATSAVLQKNKRKLLYITLPDSILATPKREQGFEQAIKEYDESVETCVKRLARPVDYNETIEILEQVIEQGFEFDALICGNDRLALVAQMYLLAKGYQIPEQVSVIGYDNMEDVASIFYPKLTTVELPHRQIGEAAALHIVMQKQHSDRVELDCPLILRDTLK